VRQDLLLALNEARAGKRRACLVRRLATHEDALVVDGEVALGGTLSPELMAAVAEAERRDKSATIETSAGSVFLQIFNPPLRLVIVGAVHIAQALAPMATMAAYAVTIVDPRSAFASEVRFPDVVLNDGWPDEAMEELSLDRRTAVVTLTHDPKLDDPALDMALRSEAFYIGALGSRRNHAGRLERLKALGYDEAALARIKGPAGIDIGAISPAEIAISVLAEMTRALRRKE
jgi:xanthine dehydrogenase accessory factor